MLIVCGSVSSWIEKNILSQTGFLGCQIDFLIQTYSKVLYLVEIKFSASPLGMSVSEEMREKVKRLALPKSYSFRCAIVTVNGVTEELRESGIFDYIIDFSDLCKS